MTSATSRALAYAALCCALSVCAAALGQERSADGNDRVEATAEAADAAANGSPGTPAVGAADTSTVGTPETTVDEEVIVRGRTRANLRLQLRLAEDAVYERFNAINSDDAFDVHCRDEAIIGSRLLRRICMPNFLRTAMAEAGEETVRGLQGSSAIDAQFFQGRAAHQRMRFTEELRRLAVEDEQLFELMGHYAELNAALSGDTLPRSAFGATLEQERAADEGALPYDAAVITDVRIGREPWRHTLRHRTFTIANFNGELRSLELDCDGRTMRLEWELGLEWTVPEGWEACTLRIDGEPTTTFALYEFE